jgi:hypothetical protein
MYGFMAFLAFLPVGSIGLLALWTLFSGLMTIYERKRVRVVPTTWNYVAGARQNASIAGPFNEIHFAMFGATAVHVLDGAGVGIIRSIEQLQITSTKVGLVADMSGVTLYALSSCWFNSGIAADTAAGTGAALTDGFRAILPLGVDMDESINIMMRFGTAVEVSSTAGAAAYNGICAVTVELLDKNPETYFAYRDQEIAVRAAAATLQQPTPYVVPGYVLAKEVYATQSVSLVTALGLLLNNIRLSQSDDMIVDSDGPTIYELQASNKGFRPRNGYILCEHRPISNNDATILTLTVGAVAIFATGMARMCYVYQAGQISQSQYISRIGARNPQAAQGAPPSPSRAQVGERKRSLGSRLFRR